MKEIWKNIKGYEGLYQISNLGRVKSFKRNQNGNILKHRYNSTGYTMFLLYKEKMGEEFITHRLVGSHFIPNPENKPEINHLNGIRDDNRLINLEWCTHSENIKHAYNIGTKSSIGERNCSSKLTEKEVLEIRSLYSTGNYYYRELSEMFNISKVQISRIITNIHWNHI